MVTVDEAHMLDIEVGSTLLNLSQNLRGEHTAPFLLVLAGTPNLEMHLGRIGATIWRQPDSVHWERGIPSLMDYVDVTFST